ncbi:MAG TPA: carbon storage regulator CsrA [Gemmataceae bacterium]|jgi:carbon storage regulator
MLVLARKSGEALVIGDGDIVITILELRGGRVRITIDAPPEVKIYRHEVWERIQDQSKDAAVERASPPAAAEGTAALP